MNLTSNNKIETNKVELQITVGPEEFEKAVAQAYRKNVSKINVPGFRKGKAPRGIIEKMYGEGVFYEDAVNALYPQAYEDAIAEAQLEPVDRPEIDMTSVDKNGFSFKAVVTVKPEVEVKDYKGIKATKTVKAVTDEDVDAEVKKLQERNGRIVEVTDRAAQDGDNTMIDFEGFVDGVAFEGGKGENYPLTLGSNQFIPGFEEQIVGHNTGDEFDVNVTFPEDYQAEELKGKAAVFKVKVNAIKTRELPEADDEFAKDVSEFDTLAELREDLRKKAGERNEAQAQDEVENTMIDTLIENMTAEIPECMFERRIDDYMNDFEYRLQSQGMNMDLYLQYTGMEKDSMRKTFRAQAERQVKLRLALEKIAQLENIEASAEDIAAEYQKMADAYQMDVEKVKSLVGEDDLKKDIVVTKAIDFVKENAEVTEEAPAAEKPKKARRTTKKKAEADTAEEPKAEETAE